MNMEVVQPQKCFRSSLKDPYEKLVMKKKYKYSLRELTATGLETCVPCNQREQSQSVRGPARRYT